MSLRTVLSAEPSSVSAARRFVCDVLFNRGLERFAETASLLTSELVTNAVLHARSGVVLELVYSWASVRIEVCDESIEPPIPRAGLPGHAGPGRGLRLVEELADSWGTYSDGEGKCVWFELRDQPEARGEALREVCLLGVPARTYAEVNLHVDQLLHELQVASSSRAWIRADSSQRLHRLITKALESYNWARSSAWEQAREALTADGRRVDLRLALPETAAGAARELLDLLEEADRRSAAGELLTLPATPEMRELRRWVVSELHSQLVLGHEPEPCPL